MSNITYTDIQDSDETVEVNKLALLKAYNDGVFDKFGNSHERQAKKELRDTARQIINE